MTRVLLIAEESIQTLNTKLLFKLANYEVEHCVDLALGVNLYDLSRITSNPFNLTVIFLRDQDMGLLERIYFRTFFDKLILVHPQDPGSETFKRQDNYIHLYQHSCLLHCVKQLVGEAQAPVDSQEGLQQELGDVRRAGQDSA